MGEGLDQMFNKVSSSSRAEDDEELGESSDHDDSSSDEASASHPTTCHVALASQLPVKRGLSKFYQGKSQSFSSFSEVRCVEDLAKKTTPKLKGKMKPSMSYANGLLHIETNQYSSFDQNKVPRVASSIARSSSTRNCKPPPIPMHK